MFLILCLKVRINGKWNLWKQFVDSGLVGQGITIRIKSFLVQTPLGSWLGLETQSCWKTSSDFQVKIVKTQWLTLGRWGFSLDNGPKLAIGQQCSCKKIPGGAKKRCLWKFIKVHWRAPLLESFLRKLQIRDLQF